MNAYDLIIGSLQNLWRMKLRAFLTISGVVIAIGAFVAMVSFGAGMQQNVTDQFEKLGLFSTMLVYPKPASDDVDSTVYLTSSVLPKLSELPGVRLAYPFDAFDIKVSYGDSSIQTEAQALPVEALQTKVFSNLESGTVFEADSGHTVIIGKDIVEELGFSDPDLIIGKSVIISVVVSVLDSGLVELMSKAGESIGQQIRDFDLDSLSASGYVERVLREEAGLAMGRFSEGFFHKQATIAETLLVVGVSKSRGGRRMRTRDVILPTEVAARMTSFGFSSDPTDLLSSVKSGTLFQSAGDGSSANYPQVTLDLTSTANYKTIKDSVEAMGYRSFSYAEEFDEIRKFFVYFNLALAAVGIVALITASLGIVNTMVMSILERRREIGVLKSLGADNKDIRIMFLVESGVIGLIGASVGIVLGWIVTRIASFVAQKIMENEGVDGMELFALPIWLILTALGFGIVVSVVAGLYPAARASRVDPVQALRSE